MPALKTAKAKFADTEKMFAKPANPRPFPPLAPLAGSFVNPSFGKATLRLDGDAPVLALQESGCELKLCDGDILTARVFPSGRFVALAEVIGPRPSAFAQCRSTRRAGTICSACPLKTARPTNSAATRSAHSMRAGTSIISERLSDEWGSPAFASLPLLNFCALLRLIETTLTVRAIAPIDSRQYRSPCVELRLGAIGHAGMLAAY